VGASARVRAQKAQSDPSVVKDKLACPRCGSRKSFVNAQEIKQKTLLTPERIKRYRKCINGHGFTTEEVVVAATTSAPRQYQLQLTKP
jgi:transcription elongation factor Elf1